MNSPQKRRLAALAVLMGTGLALAVPFAVPSAINAQSLPSARQEPRQMGRCDENTIPAREPGLTLSCSCSANEMTSDRVWGTDEYTDDSHICTAARHAGALSGNAGGQVTIELTGARDTFPGSSHNGIQSQNYGNWGGGFRFVTYGEQSSQMRPASQASGPPATDIGECHGATSWRGQNIRLTCTCPAGASDAGSTWGSGPYTDDSYICKAAVHAGAITRAGGRVTVELLSGRESYSGSTRNGVTTRDYGNWAGSYDFVTTASD